MGGPGAAPFEVSVSRGASAGSRALQSSGGVGVKAFITASVSEIAGLDMERPVEALLFVSSGQDFAGAGSKKGMQVSGSQVSFSLVQDGQELLVRGLKDNPIQITAPVADPADIMTKCTGQPGELTRSCHA